MKRAGVLLLAGLGVCAQGQWVTKAIVPEARSTPAGAIIGSTFYYFGGFTVNNFNNVTAWKFSIPLNMWSPMASLPNIGVGNGGVSNVDAAAIGTDIYLPGGYNGTTGTNRLLKYDSTTNTWSTIASDPVPVNVFGNATVALNGKLYVLGGNQASGVLSTNCYVYNPSASAGQRWQTIAPMPLARKYAGAAVIGNQIYLMGGLNSSNVDLDTVAVYNAGTNTWSASPPPNMMLHRGGPGGFNYFGKPYVVGGGVASLTATGELLSNGSWVAGPALNNAMRTFAYDGNARFFVKAGGWNGAVSNITEVYDTATLPANMTLVRGILLSGSVADLIYSDDIRVLLRPGVVLSSSERPIQLTINSNTAPTNPQMISITVESSANQPNVRQYVDAFNFVSSTWVQVDSRTLAMSDQSISLPLPSPYPRFVSSSGVMRIRLSYIPAGPILAYPWQVRVDEMTFSSDPGP